MIRDEDRDRFNPEPLRPIYRTQRPPWVSRYTGREYHGQVNWWAEPGLPDPKGAAHQFQGVMKRYREEDRNWFDPPVPDGTSMPGPFGKDNARNKNTTIRADTPANLFDWQKKVMEGSHQYRQIAAKWDISPEHPGIPIAQNLESFQHKRPDEVVNQAGHGAFLWTNSWLHFGPRFWDKPLNEGCLEKGAALLKYAALFNVVVTLTDARANNTIPADQLYFRPIMRRYMQLLPVPAIGAFTWGVALCTAANVRHVDDAQNHWIAGPVLGFVIASLKNNIGKGAMIGGAATFLGVAFHYIRVFQDGLQGHAYNPNASRELLGPHAWKLFNQGDWKVSKTNY